MTYGRSVTVDGEFAQAVEAVKAALKDQGFGIITEIDMQATMKEKLGEDYEPLLILGACNPPLAHRALQADPSIGMLLPCNVVVRRVGGANLVEAIDPDMMVDVTGVEALGPVAQDAGTRLAAALAALG